MIEKILVAVDGSQSAEKAAVFALECAEQMKAAVVCITVIRPIEAMIGMKLEYVYVEESESIANKLLAEGERNVNKIVEMGKRRGVNIEGKVVRGEIVAEAIVESAKSENADTIVVAMHGNSGFLSEDMGSVTRRLFSSSPPCPVVVVPPSA